MSNIDLTKTTDRYAKVNTVTLIAMGAFHVLAAAAFFYVDWGAIALAIALHWIAIGWGIGLGYHRLHTHRSYKAPLWFEYFLAVCGTLTLEGGPIFWVAVHRIHHQKSDQEGDPHTPRDGRWWSHMLWTLFGESLNSDIKKTAKYAPDLAKDPFYRWLSKWHWVPLTVLGIGLYAFGGLPYLLWCVFFRVVFGLHATWLVNSATHLWGSRRFNTTDDSRNSWWVALLTFGEGWHNNHHAHPTSARHGMAWYEFDMTWITIRFLELIGFVKDVRLPAKAQMELMQQTAAERRAA